jgi:voltage-gated potassium channel
MGAQIFKCVALVASQLIPTSVDGFVLPIGMVRVKEGQSKQIYQLFSTKYERSSDTEREIDRLHKSKFEFGSAEDGDMNTTLAAEKEEQMIEGTSHGTNSSADEAAAAQEEVVDNTSQLMSIQNPLDDDDVISLSAADDVVIDTVTSNQRRTNQKNPRMQMFAYLSQPVIEVRIIGLVLLSCFLQAINTLDNIPAEMHQGIDMVDTFFVYIFAIEFFLRWWSAGRFQLRYLAKPLAAIDSVVVILPLILSGLLPIYEYSVMSGFIPGVSLPAWLLSSSSANSALLNLRLLRILKFQRVLTDQNTYMNFEMALGMKQTDVKPYQLQLARVVISIFTLLSVSTGLIYTAENETNPMFSDYFTTLYFGLTTLTTVGFGDITPVTFQGRLVVMASILAGVIIIPAQAASLAEAYLDFQREREGKRLNVNKQNKVGFKPACPKCGAGFQRADASFCWNCGKQLDE